MFHKQYNVLARQEVEDTCADLLCFSFLNLYSDQRPEHIDKHVPFNHTVFYNYKITCFRIRSGEAAVFCTSGYFYSMNKLRKEPLTIFFIKTLPLIHVRTYRFCFFFISFVAFKFTHFVCDLTLS